MYRAQNLIFTLLSFIFIAVLAFYAFFYAKSAKNAGYKLGLDLSGGTQLTYSIDLQNIEKENIKDSLSALRDTIERRVNFLGVAEPSVQIEKNISPEGKDVYKLVVELPGFDDSERAKESLGKTPVLEFRLKKDAKDTDKITNPNDLYGPAVLTGAHLSKANVEMIQGAVGIEPSVSLKFTKEGAEQFAKITEENVGKELGIFLDGELVSSPVIREKISGGTASISGSFTSQEARELKKNLNLGAIPVPIHLDSVFVIGPSLGNSALSSAIDVAILASALVAIFMIIWYRLLGFLSVFALAFYVLFMLSIFKFVPITLTTAGLAGFILSIGMALDANILIFERIKEELNKGKNLKDSAKEGFERAWQAIRDANLSSLLIAMILFWFATGLVRGFALVFGIGVLVSMLSAYFVSKSFVFVIADFLNDKKWARKYFKSGFNFKLR